MRDACVKIELAPKIADELVQSARIASHDFASAMAEIDERHTGTAAP